MKKITLIATFLLLLACDSTTPISDNTVTVIPGLYYEDPEVTCVIKMNGESTLEEYLDDTLRCYKRWENLQMK